MELRRIAGLRVHCLESSSQSKVVLLHGFGAPGDDLAGLGDVLVSPTRGLYFPEALLGLGGMYGPGRAWWHIDIERMIEARLTSPLEAVVRHVPEGIEPAAEAVVALLRELMTPETKLVLGGFSQGAMLALHVALTTDLPLAGLALLSGTMIAADTWRPLFASRKGLPVLQSHGDQDPILPFPIAELLAKELREGGLDVEFVRFPGGHGIGPQALMKLKAFLDKTLP